MSESGCPHFGGALAKIEVPTVSPQKQRNHG
jgi:hypothetical protein